MQRIPFVHANQQRTLQQLLLNQTDGWCGPLIATVVSIAVARVCFLIVTINSKNKPDATTDKLLNISDPVVAVCCVVLWCAALCYAVLLCAVLCCVVVCYGVPCCVVLGCFVWFASCAFGNAHGHRLSTLRGRPWPRAICFCECLSGRQGSWPCRAVVITQVCKVTTMDSTTRSAAPGWDVVAVTSVLAVAVGRCQSRHCGVRTENRTLVKCTLEPLNQTLFGDVTGHGSGAIRGRFWPPPDMYSEACLASA